MTQYAVGAIAAFLIAVASAPLAARGNQSSEPVKSPEDKVVCKSSLQTGTRFRKKICHTVGQWETIAEENRRALDEMQGATVRTERDN